MNRTRTPHSLADWLAALEGAGWDGKRAGSEWAGPCPKCGGTDRFHVRAGRSAEVVAGCRHGCTFADLARAVHGNGPRAGAGLPPWRNRPRTRPKTRPKAPKPLEAPKTRNGGGTPDFAALAEEVEEALTLGKRARAWIEARHLDPERLEGAGWRSSTGIEGRALLAEHGAALPQLIRRAESLLWLPVWDADGRPASYRARPLDIGGVGTRTLPGDKGRIYGAEAWCAPPGEVLHVAEGETDREALIEAGALWAVGLPGAGALHGAVVDLARAVEPSRVCPWFDGDRPGKWAAAALAGKLTAAGIAVRRWHFPPGMDCGDAWRQNPTALAAKVREMEDPNPRSEAA